MAPSESSGSSFTSSSLGRPPTYSRSLTSPNDSTWTPTSGISTLSTSSTSGSYGQQSIRPLDLGPPGYQATMYPAPTLYSAHLLILGRWLTSRRLFLLEFFSRILRTNAQSILARGRSLGRSSAEFCGNAATRTSCSSIIVCGSPIRRFHEMTNTSRRC